jgi:hypothetical protein
MDAIVQVVYDTGKSKLRVRPFAVLDGSNVDTTKFVQFPSELRTNAGVYYRCQIHDAGAHYRADKKTIVPLSSQRAYEMAKGEDAPPDPYTREM